MTEAEAEAEVLTWHDEAAQQLQQALAAGRQVGHQRVGLVHSRTTLVVIRAGGAIQSWRRRSYSQLFWCCRW